MSLSRIVMAACLPFLGLCARTAWADERLIHASQVQPLLDKYCVSCHGSEKKKADLDLGRFRGADERSLLAAAGVWQDVAERVESHDMPPDNKPQPTPAEVETLAEWAEQIQARAAAQGKRDPGRVTLRRLNRPEFNNTIRDLLGLDGHPAQDFPTDDVGYGFDNIGDVLTMPPVLVERYLNASERIAERAIISQLPPRRRQRIIQVEKLVPTPSGSTVRGVTLNMFDAGVVRAQVMFPAPADYVFSIRGWGRSVQGVPPQLVLRVDGHDVKTFDVPNSSTHGLATKVPMETGPHVIELAFANPSSPDISAKHQSRRRQITLDALHIDGPIIGKEWALPASHTRIILRPSSKGRYRQDAREFLGALANRAFRRPATEIEVENLAGFVDRTIATGGSFERGMQMALRAVLLAPSFLYRPELDADGPTAAPADIRPLNQWELASRLSYFLWSSMPDEALFTQARIGALQDPAVLASEVKRMLADPKAEALTDNFAGQWLQIRGITNHRPSRKQFPEFDGDLGADMLRETELFFSEVVRQDLNVLSFLDGEFTFVNERLAKHYGIADVMGTEFRRVSLAGTGRGGVLTQGSVLTVTSNPNRTSPVKRGRWVLEQLLGTPPPPPPPGIPELKEKGRTGTVGTVRARMEQHRTDPNCAVCHKKMDPLGLGLENFNAVGAWREKDENQPIDSSGTLPGGRTFVGPTELRKVLIEREAQFRKTLATKLLTYALGRGLETFDRPVVDKIIAQMGTQKNTFSSLVVAIANSDPFLNRRSQETLP